MGFFFYATYHQKTSKPKTNKWQYLSLKSKYPPESTSKIFYVKYNLWHKKFSCCLWRTKTLPCFWLLTEACWLTTWNDWWIQFDQVESHHKWPTPGWDNSFFTYLGILILEPEMAVPYGDEKSYPFLLYFAAFFVKMTCKQSFLWLKLPCTVV